MTKKIDKLNEMFPYLNAVCTTEWDGVAGGIWFRQEGALHPDGRPYFDYYSGDPEREFGVHPALVEALSEMGLHGEAHDAGTLMAYD